MIEWIPCELHTHTRHSDGRKTLPEMARKAADFGLRAMALTDHNTTSGWADIPEAEQTSGVAILPGMEWTTFYGHMVALGIASYVDWRHLGIHDIDAGIAAIKAAGGIAGIAHPFRLGAPYCCGCYWQFEVENYRDVDYMEVWSEGDPWGKQWNRRAYNWWTELLNAGYKISGISGRDWHGDDNMELIAATYLGVDAADTKGNYVAALAAGRAYCTLGPTMDIAFTAGDKTYTIGGRVPAGFDSGNLNVKVDIDARAAFRTWESERMELRLVCQHGMAKTFAMDGTRGGGVREVECDLEETKLGSWFRVELWDGDQMRAFTNPLYLG